jgi:hypothetical protein
MTSADDIAEQFANSIELLSAIYEPTFMLVPNAVGRSFYGLMAVEEVTDDDPPWVATRAGKWLDVSFDFEQVLGLYEPDLKRIQLFSRGIAWAAQQLGVHPTRLERIVKMHEWAHALHHLGSWTYIKGKRTAYASVWRTKKVRYKNAPEEFKEQLAQLMTLLAIRHQRVRAHKEEVVQFCKKLEGDFFALIARQSPLYQLPDIVKEMDQIRLQRKVRMLLEQSDRGVYATANDIRTVLE